MPEFASTAITRAEYDPWNKLLSLWFAGVAAPYHYRDVPIDIYEGLCRARSKGAYFNNRIRERYQPVPEAS